MRKAMTKLMAAVVMLGFVGTPDATASTDDPSVVNTSGSTVFCATPQGDGKANGTIVTVWNCDGAPSQEWESDAVTGHLINVASGKCLTPQGDALDTNGAVLTLWTCNSANLPAQRWTLNESGSMRIGANMWITPKGNTMANGVYLTLWSEATTSWGRALQDWQFIRPCLLLNQC